MDILQSEIEAVSERIVLLRLQIVNISRRKALLYEELSILEELERQLEEKINQESEKERSLLERSQSDTIDVVESENEISVKSELQTIDSVFYNEPDVYFAVGETANIESRKNNIDFAVSSETDDAIKFEIQDSNDVSEFGTYFVNQKSFEESVIVQECHDEKLKQTSIENKLVQESHQLKEPRNILTSK